MLGPVHQQHRLDDPRFTTGLQTAGFGSLGIEAWGLVRLWLFRVRSLRVSYSGLRSRVRNLRVSDIRVWRLGVRSQSTLFYLRLRKSIVWGSKDLLKFAELSGPKLYRSWN